MIDTRSGSQPRECKVSDSRSMLNLLQGPLPKNLSDIRASVCCVAKLYRFSDERNVWQWQRLQTYAGSYAYTEDLDAAKRAVEKQRLQGSRWWIHEMPSIVIRGGDFCFLIATKNSLTPFLEFRGDSFRSPLMRTIVPKAMALGYVFVIEPYLNLAEYPFLSFASYVRRGKRELGWVSHSKKRDLTYLHRLLEKLQNAMQSD